MWPLDVCMSYDNRYDNMPLPSYTFPDDKKKKGKKNKKLKVWESKTYYNNKK